MSNPTIASKNARAADESWANWPRIAIAASMLTASYHAPPRSTPLGHTRPRYPIGGGDRGGAGRFDDPLPQSGQLFVSFHESKRGSITTDRFSYRDWHIHPVLDRVFPFESTKEAMAYVEKGRAKGKVVVKVR